MAGGWPGPMTPGEIPGLLSGPAQDPFSGTLGDEDRFRQLVNQGVPENVARYMVQAPSVYDGGQTSGAWPYPYQGQAQEEQLQTGPQRSDAINRQMWQQRLTPSGGREALLQQMMRSYGLG